MIRELQGEKYDSRGRKTGDSVVSLYRPINGTTVLIQIGSRSSYVEAAELKAAILELVPDDPPVDGHGA